MKKSISNRDVERIAEHAGLSATQVRQALALKGDVPQDLSDRVMRSAQALRYTISARDRVAMAANTSVATVNRAYRPEARHLVRPDLLRTIEAEAARLGYTPDLVAQARRTQGSPIVTLCVELDRLFNPYHATMLRFLMEAVLRRGLHPVITPVTPERALPELAQSGVTTAVVLWEGQRTAQQVAMLEATGRRAVMIGWHEALPSVAPDWSGACAHLTQRALERQYTTLHLGYLHANAWGPSARLEGVARALRQHQGPRPNLRLWVAPDLNLPRLTRDLAQSGRHDAADLLDELLHTPGALERRPALNQTIAITEITADVEALHARGERVAVFGLPDMAARQLLYTLQHQHPDWHVGEDIGVVGYDNIEPLLPYLAPILTTVAYNMRQLADRVADLVQSGLDRAVPPPSFDLLPAQMIVRESL
ncbi:LacI family DNA-binding transcriptional regulator [Deinococcus maricopensis]|uniref:Transcriptional regulator LacI/GalR-like sensor domain-containing protein n=1 Tax=Deinococcus maricopensis (strain DSM 21211 / LMG 22137 / NRRL B-23946 / LB-34) TaxID=709986 RepID=E8U3D8_DEIML|nr:LacI family DNA-binding transcriptional regulator [Deinococcus maricopensis]ADV65809.1 hypothetical protein Deima_0145 [Deinococcus maricopensis DSM 21211]